jgi:DNA anti-recombination protein RmuC
MELPRPEPGQNLPDNESRIIKLEGQVLDLSVELKLLRQTVDTLPEKVCMLVKAEMAEYLRAHTDGQTCRNEALRKDIEGKFEDWRKENEAKLERWRSEDHRKLEEWRSENDRKLEEWRRENDRKLEEWRRENDRKLEEWRRENVREMRNWFRGITCIVIAAVIAQMMA